MKRRKDRAEKNRYEPIERVNKDGVWSQLKIWY